MTSRSNAFNAILILSISIILLAAPVATLAESNVAFDLQYVDSDLWGNIADVDFSGTYAFCAMNYGLGIYDNTSPESATLVSTVDLEGSNCLRVAVNGDYAYCITEDDSIKIADISTPANPSLAYAYSPGGTIGELEFFGSTMIFIEDDSLLQFIDMTDPSSPTTLAQFDTTYGFDFFAIDGNYLYAYTTIAGDMTMFDISDPSTPSVAGIFGQSGQVDIDASGNVCVIMADSNFTLLNVSNPAAITIYTMGLVNDNGIATRLEGDTLYILDESDLTIHDLSSLVSLSTFGSTSFTVSPTSLILNGEYAYCNNYLNGLEMIDISDPSTPSSTGAMGIDRYIQSVTTKTDYAYVCDYNNGLYIYSLADTANPALTGELLNATTNDVDVFGNYAFIASTSYGLKVADISDPASPSIVGTCNTTGNAIEVKVIDTIAYVADQSNGLAIINVADKANPTIIGGYDTSAADAYAYDFVISGPFAYIAVGNHGLQILDITDPTAPFLVAGLNTGGSCSSIQKSGNYVYLSSSPNSIYIIDISSPMSPTLANSYSPLVGIQSLSYSNNTLFATANSGFYLFDASTPDTLSLITSYAPLGAFSDAAIRGSFAYIADEYAMVTVNLFSAPLDVTENYTELMPANFNLGQNYPNPFNPITNIDFSLPMASNVVIDIYNILGQKVVNLIDENLTAGSYTVDWNGSDIASGIYFYRIKAGDYTETKRMVLLK